MPPPVGFAQTMSCSLVIQFGSFQGPTNATFRVRINSLYLSWSMSASLLTSYVAWEENLNTHHPHPNLSNQGSLSLNFLFLHLGLSSVALAIHIFAMSALRSTCSFPGINIKRNAARVCKKSQTTGERLSRMPGPLCVNASLCLQHSLSSFDLSCPVVFALG